LLAQSLVFAFVEAIGGAGPSVVNCSASRIFRKVPMTIQVLIAYNDTADLQRFKIVWHGRALYVILPTNTPVTFEWRVDGK
jgi:hypothetical protein